MCSVYRSNSRSPYVTRASHPHRGGGCLAAAYPEFLETNANRDAAGPVLAPTVCIDGLMTGDVSALRDMPTRLIAEIRFVPARDAATYHSQAHRTGDIMVYTNHARAVQPPF